MRDPLMTLGRSVLAIAIVTGGPSQGCLAAPPEDATIGSTPQPAGSPTPESRREARRAEVRLPKGASSRRRSPTRRSAGRGATCSAAR